MTNSSTIGWTDIYWLRANCLNSADFTVISLKIGWTIDNDFQINLLFSLLRFPSLFTSLVYFCIFKSLPKFFQNFSIKNLGSRTWCFRTTMYLFIDLIWIIYIYFTYWWNINDIIGNNLFACVYIFEWEGVYTLLTQSLLWIQCCVHYKLHTFDSKI